MGNQESRERALEAAKDQVCPKLCIIPCLHVLSDFLPGLLMFARSHGR
jgi:hypothetical protein